MIQIQQNNSTTQTHTLYIYRISGLAFKQVSGVL